MTGKPYFNVPAFLSAAFALRQKGDIVWNPAEHDIYEYGMFWTLAPHGRMEEVPSGTVVPSYREVLLWDLLIIMTKCTHLVLLPGWETSRGACVEKEIAELCGLAVEFYGSAA